MVWCFGVTWEPWCLFRGFGTDPLKIDRHELGTVPAVPFRAVSPGAVPGRVPPHAEPCLRSVWIRPRLACAVLRLVDAEPSRAMFSRAVPCRAPPRALPCRATTPPSDVVAELERGVLQLLLCLWMSVAHLAISRLGGCHIRGRVERTYGRRSSCHSLGRAPWEIYVLVVLKLHSRKIGHGDPQGATELDSKGEGRMSSCVRVPQQCGHCCLYPAVTLTVLVLSAIAAGRWRHAVVPLL